MAAIEAGRPLELTSAFVTYRVEEREDGRLELTVTSGPGAELTFLWSNGHSAQGALDGDLDGDKGVSELETSDGRVRVRVQDPPGAK